MQAVRERVVRGTPDFPLDLYGFKTQTVNVAYHWHPEIEMIYLKSGEFTVTVNEQSLKAVSGDIIFVNGEQLHSINQNKGETEFYSVVFYPQLLDFENKNPFQRLLLDPIKNGKLVMPMRVSKMDGCYSELVRQFERIISAKKAANAECEQLIAIYEMLIALYRENMLSSGKERNNNSYNTEILKKVIKYIDEHIGEQVKLKNLAACASMSEKYFCSFFKRHAGCSPIEYVNRVKIERACELIKTQKMSITDAALETGFESLSYFVRRFKRQMGVSPSQYKKQNSKNG